MKDHHQSLSERLFYHILASVLSTLPYTKQLKTLIRTCKVVTKTTGVPLTFCSVYVCVHVGVSV